MLSMVLETELPDVEGLRVVVVVRPYADRRAARLAWLAD